jgi:flagellin
MSSINTNLGAMVALDTLKGINKNLGMVQNEIATGKSINSAKDNAALWSISTVMESDVAGFEQISNSLNLGSATVGVARTAAEDVVTNLQDIRDSIIAAQEGNVDRGKLQTDIDEAVKQIQSTVAGAQFNGQNLLTGEGDVEILSSLNRDSSGAVTAGKISVTRQNLTTDAVGSSGSLSTGDGGNITFVNDTYTPNASPSDVASLVFDTSAELTTGTSTTLDLGTGAAAEIVVVSTAGQTVEEYVTAIAAAINDDVNGVLDAGVTATVTSGNVLTIEDSDVTAGTTQVTMTATQTKPATPAGLLEGLDTLDVETSDTTAAQALTDIEGFLTAAIDAAAAFGSKQGRIDSQISFVSSLGDSLKAGISTLTDANLEEASARLQALQVQQQLGVQALSIANQAPQALLSLFR